MSDQVAPYPPYSGDDVCCPKRGGVMDKQYQRAGTVFRPDLRWLTVMNTGRGPEWLLRTCRDCWYRRAEMCADAVTGS